MINAGKRSEDKVLGVLWGTGSNEQWDNMFKSIRWFSNLYLQL